MKNKFGLLLSISILILFSVLMLPSIYAQEDKDTFGGGLPDANNYSYSDPSAPTDSGGGGQVATDDDGGNNPQNSVIVPHGSNNNSNSSNDYDNDGVLNNNDQCPFISGRGSQYGGVDGGSGCPVDSDGDDIDDGEDRCPWHMGEPEDLGCPTWEVVEEKILLAYLLPDGPCQIATPDTGRVNIRQHPDIESPINSAMFPQYGYSVFGVIEQNGRIWYLVEDGWVASWVTRSGGDCDDLPKLDGVLLPDISGNSAS